VLYLAFFCSGLSGLIYQVVWVRVFGNVFGNRVRSTSGVRNRLSIRSRFRLWKDSTRIRLCSAARGASAADVSRARNLAERRDRVIFGSAYLGAIVPETAEVHNLLGIALAAKGRIDEGIMEFRHALRLEPDSAQTHWHLGAALAYHGARDEALEELRLAVQLDPSNSQARHDLEVVLATSRR